MFCHTHVTCKQAPFYCQVEGTLAAAQPHSSLACSSTVISSSLSTTDIAGSVGMGSINILQQMVEEGGVSGLLLEHK